MDSDLLATCNALGYLEEDRYFKDPDCIDTVKSLIKYLHHEDENHEIRNQLGAGRIVKNDLLPILRQYPDDDALCAAVLRLLVNLTQPVLLCFGNKVPKEVDQYHSYLDILSHNQSYKQAFASVETWKVLAQKVYDILEKEWEDRTPDDSMTVERILVLCRNVLHVPTFSGHGKEILEEESTHDKLVVAIHNSGIDSMILYLASSNEEQQWCLHVAEIVSLLLKEQSAGDLAAVNNARERDREGDELRNLRMQEEKMRQLRVLKQSSRHSRFGGTYVAKGKAALVDDNDLVIHKALPKCNDFSLDEGKRKLRKAKNKRPLINNNIKRRTSREVQQILKDFCIGLLENGYNHLMFSIRDKISRESSDEHDETYYFSIMSFMLEFNRRHKFHIDQVSETIQLATLHFINVSIVSSSEMMMTDKEACATWGKRLHHALCCYKEFLLTIQQMQISPNEAYVESSKVLLHNIFYISEYREVFLALLRKYEEPKQTHAFLDDLVQATHLFIRLFEKYCKNSAVVVEKKNKKRKKKQKKKSSASTSNLNILTEEERLNCWNEIEDGVKTATQTGELPEPVSDLFDPTSDIPEDEQQQKALVRVQSKLHTKEPCKAVSLLRQARELWPEIDVFGASGATWEDDVTTLKEICLADMAGLPGEDHPNREEEVEEEDEEEVLVSSKEVQLNFNDYMKKFADYKIVQPLIILLAKFETNSQHTNHCVAKLLHRVCFDLKMYGLLFQASVFRCFQRIFQASKVNPLFKELAGFARYIVGRFFEVLPTNDKLFAELLFWKQTAVQVYEMTEGYGTYAKSQGSKNVVSWSESEQTELAQLYEEFKDGELDVVDCMLARITDESRSRRQVVKQLINQGLVEDASSLKRKKGPRVNVWREHEEMELKRLLEEYQNSEDPIGNIVQMMSTKRSRTKVIEKILAMGLVQDRKDLYKRRKRGPNIKSGDPDIVHAGGDSDSENGDYGREESQSESDDESWALIDLPSCIRKASDDGFVNEIAWVKSNLEQAINDRKQMGEGDEIQSLPLVPLLEEQEDAMQNSAFRRMLHFIGVQKPSTGQEMFWRIPTGLSLEGLEYSVEVLSRPAKKSSPERIHRAEDVLEDVLDGADLSGAKRKRPTDSDSDDDMNTGIWKTAGMPEGNITQKKRKRISALKDSSDDDDDNVDNEKRDEFRGLAKPLHGSGRNISLEKHGSRLLLDDSDVEEESLGDDNGSPAASEPVENQPSSTSNSSLSRSSLKPLLCDIDAEEEGKENRDDELGRNALSDEDEVKLSLHRRRKKRTTVLDDGDDDDF